MNFIKLAAAAMIVVGGATAAFAQATAPAPTTAPVAPKAPVATTPPPAASATTVAPKAANPALKQATTPEGQACSAEADAKNLHGKERSKFRSKCVRAAKAAAAKGAAPVTAPPAAAAKKI